MRYLVIILFLLLIPLHNGYASDQNFSSDGHEFPGLKDGYARLIFYNYSKNRPVNPKWPITIDGVNVGYHQPETFFFVDIVEGGHILGCRENDSLLPHLIPTFSDEIHPNSIKRITVSKNKIYYIEMFFTFDVHVIIGGTHSDPFILMKMVTNAQGKALIQNLQHINN